MVKPAVLTAFWNRHKKFKKIKKIGKPSHYVIICGQVPRKNNKLVIRQLFLKSVLKIELSCVKIHGFQDKWSILWPHSWHSLFKWSHIEHKGASWNSKQWCLTEFSFSLHGKFIFHFTSARNEFFCVKDLPYICCKIGSNQFSKILGHI